MWPDGIYPHRFDFRLTHEDENVAFNDQTYPLEVVDAIRRSAIGQGKAILINTHLINTQEPQPSTWIFQANPDIYDVRAAVEVLRDTDWLAQQHKERIQPGDRVYLWESGDCGGIVAVAEISEAVRVRPRSADDAPFTKVADKLQGDLPRAGLRIHKVVDPILTRAELRAEPLLANLSILKFSQGTNFPVTLPEAQVIERLLAGRLRDPVPQPRKDTPALVQPKQLAPDDLARAIYSTVDEAAELVGILRDRKQVILEGPPGAGKTFVAEKLARYVTSNSLTGARDGRVVLVQFHQSYGYEDFVQGIRPETNEQGQLAYRVRDGVFKRLCAAAASSPGKDYAIVIDEMVAPPATVVARGG